MKPSEQRLALEILGFGVTTKLLSNPIPLGGYSGVELGMSSESISLEDIRRLGARDVHVQEFNFSNLSIGKGFYHNVDLFINFTPTLQSHSLIAYGGLLRWSFFKVQSFPASLSFVAHSSEAAYSDALAIHTIGASLIISFNMEDLSLYFGGGKARAIGTFFGGSDALYSSTDSLQTERLDALESQSILGITFQMKPFFLNLEVDRFTQSYYSGKIGLRF